MASLHDFSITSSYLTDQFTLKLGRHSPPSCTSKSFHGFLLRSSAGRMLPFLYDSAETIEDAREFLEQPSTPSDDRRCHPGLYSKSTASATRQSEPSNKPTYGTQTSRSRYRRVTRYETAPEEQSFGSYGCTRRDEELCTVYTPYNDALQLKVWWMQGSCGPELRAAIPSEPEDYMPLTIENLETHRESFGDIKIFRANRIVKYLDLLDPRFRSEVNATDIPEDHMEWVQHGALYMDCPDVPDVNITDAWGLKRAKKPRDKNRRVKSQRDLRKPRESPHAQDARTATHFSRSEAGVLEPGTASVAPTEMNARSHGPSMRSSILRYLRRLDICEKNQATSGEPRRKRIYCM